MRTRFYIIVGTLIAFAGTLGADTLELRNGQLLNGQYVGGTEQTVRFMTGGETKVIPRGDIVALTMSGTISGNAGATSGFTGTTTGAGTSTRAITTLPAGTPLEVRINENLSSEQSGGTRFSGTLVQGLNANGIMVAPAGSAVYGRIAQSEEAGRLRGQSGLVLVLTDIAINGQTRPLVTNPVSMTGQSEGRRTLRRSAAGAGIGGIVDGGSGAGKGAAIGAGAGVLRQGQAVNVPAGSMMQFSLSQPLTVP